MGDYISVKQGDFILFEYTNYKGEWSVRNALVLDVLYGSNKYHPEKQFLIHARDLNKNEIRYFAMKDMKIIDTLA